MSNKQVGRINNNKSGLPTNPRTFKLKKEVVGRVSNEAASSTGQVTTKKEIVGRVSNESEENAGLGTTSHEEEVGVVNNEKKHE